VGFENGHLLRVVLSANGPGGRDAVTVLHYDNVDQGLGATDDTEQNLADRFRDDVVNAYAALFHSTWTINPVIVEDERDPQNPTNARSAWTSGNPVVGTRVAGSNELPPGLCGIATLRTAHVGRRFRGRIFLPGSIVEDDQDAGIVGSSIVGPWQAFLDAIPKQPDLVSGVTTEHSNWVVYSRTQRAANLDPYASPVTSAVAKNKLHYLRSRAV
jgi:hypothetical protein